MVVASDNNGPTWPHVPTNERLVFLLFTLVFYIQQVNKIIVLLYKLFTKSNTPFNNNLSNRTDPHSRPPTMSSLTFEDLIDQADMPPPGPDYYDARRALWLAPRNSTSPATRTHPPIHQRLTQLLSSPLPLHGDEVWHSGLERVWLSLSSGGRLKQRLPMDMLVCFLFYFTSPPFPFTSSKDKDYTRCMAA